MNPKYISLAPFIPWKKMERPIPWDRVFGRPATLEAEIGFGLGDFLVSRALRYPKINLVGMELGWPQVRRALRKIALAGVTNVRVVRIDARVALERLFPQRSLHNVHALFPCPWPKTRHTKRRLFSRDFLRLLNSRLTDGGKARMVTDHRPYHEWALEQVTGTGFETGSNVVPPRFSTKYERKWEAHGQQWFYELILVKREHIEHPIKEDGKLMTHRIHDFDPEQFHFKGAKGRIVVEGKEYLYDPKRYKGMLRCVVEEEEWFQELWIEIVRLNDLWHIRPAKGCSTVPTAGVQRALDLVRDAALNNSAPGEKKFGE